MDSFDSSSFCNDCFTFDIYTASSLGDLHFINEFIKDHGSSQLKCNNNAGWNVLLYAYAGGHTQVVELLLNSGCTVNCRTQDNVSPLMLSIKNCDFQTFNQCLELSDIEEKDARGWSAIFYAVFFSRIQCVVKLLSVGANITCVDNRGQTPVTVAVSVGVESIVQELLKYVTYVDGTFHQRDQLLLLAKTKDPKIYRLIMQHDKKMQQWGKLLSPIRHSEKENQPLTSPNLNASFLGIRFNKTSTYSPSQAQNKTIGNKPQEPSVHEFLKRIGLEKYSAIFQDEEVDFETFLTLNEENLKEIGIKLFGPRRKIHLAIQRYNNMK